MRTSEVEAMVARFESIMRNELVALRAQVAALSGQVIAVRTQLDVLTKALADEEEEPIPDDGLDALPGRDKASHEL